MLCAQDCHECRPMTEAMYNNSGFGSCCGAEFLDEKLTGTVITAAELKK